jgi:hypothetical protein
LLIFNKRFAKSCFVYDGGSFSAPLVGAIFTSNPINQTVAHPAIKHGTSGGVKPSVVT